MSFIGDALFGSEPEQVGTAQSPGQAWLQNTLKPLIQRGVYQGLENRSLYNVPQLPNAPSFYKIPDAPEAPGVPDYPGYGVGSYQTPQAPFSSPADFAGGYETILNRMIEPFGESLGSARGGWSGSGQQVLGSAMGEIAPQIMNQYTQSMLPYAQMQGQQARDVWGAQTQYDTSRLGNLFNAQLGQGNLGYTMGQIPQWQMEATGPQQQANLRYLSGDLPYWQAQTQARSAPWNLASMYSGTYGSPMVQQGQQGMFGTAANMLPFFGLGSLFEAF